MSSSRMMRFSNYDVRKYDDGLGRFTCLDALWEKYYGWTPYPYSMNNPVNLLDGNGMFIPTRKGEIGYGKDADGITGFVAVADHKSNPKYGELLQKLPGYLKDNPELLSRIATNAGVSEKQVLKDYSLGSGPEVTLYNGSNWFYSAGKIAASNGHVEDFTNPEISSWTDGHIEGNAFFILQRLTHEYLHYTTGIRDEGKIKNLMNNIFPGLGDPKANNSSQDAIINGDYEPIGVTETYKQKNQENDDK